jgi:uncharacterized protein YkwD
MHFRSRHLPALSALTAAALISMAPAATARAHHTCKNANTPATKASRAAMRDAVVCLINQQRVNRHLPALRARRSLDRSAQKWTDQMVASGQFTHGVDFAARITAAGFIWSAAGENIATGFETPRDVVSAWMGSTDHCRNILDPTYADIGTGVNAHAVGNFASGPSTWTQDFGLWMGQGAPSGNQGPANGCPYHI